MAENEEHKVDDRVRDRRVLIAWAAAFGLLGIMALLSWIIAMPVLEVRTVVARVPPEEGITCDIACMNAMVALGGRARAAKRIGLYLRMPEWAAPNKKAAVQILTTTDEPGFPVMIRNMKNSSMVVSSAVLWAMCQGHPSARHAVPQLIEAALGTEDLLAISAIIALGKVGPDARQAVPALIQCLAHENSGRRRYACKALGEIGDRQAIEPLKAAVDDGDETVRTSAKAALEVFAAP